MKLTMDVQLVAKNELYGFARKEFETNILPFVGLEIEDTAWKEPKKVLSVVVSYQNEYIYVGLEEYDIQNEKHLTQVKDMFKGHGWEVH